MGNAFLGFALGGLVVAILVAASGAKGAARWESEAIAAGHAHYNPMTGEFEWNPPCGEVPQKEK